MPLSICSHLPASWPAAGCCPAGALPHPHPASLPRVVMQEMGQMGSGDPSSVASVPACLLPAACCLLGLLRHSCSASSVGPSFDPCLHGLIPLMPLTFAPPGGLWIRAHLPVSLSSPQLFVAIVSIINARMPFGSPACPAFPGTRAFPPRPPIFCRRAHTPGRSAPRGGRSAGTPPTQMRRGLSSAPAPNHPVQSAFYGPTNSDCESAFQDLHPPVARHQSGPGTDPE